ncbi:MAG: transposase family protein, partial [Fimbriimonadaceae bacterium]|nr:transposase family protein [Fimbriimonadaceae bacterium]
MRVEFVGRWIKGYGLFMKCMSNICLLKDHPEIELRLEVIKFYDEFGEKATRKAFKVARSTVFLWKQKLKASHGKLYILANLSRKPHTARRMLVEEETYIYIKNLRQQYPRLGKEKIARLLKAERSKNPNIQLLSPSAVGKLIRRNNWFLYLGERRKNKSIRPDKQRVFGYPIQQAGDLMRIDTVVRFDHGVKRYILTAIDPVTKFAFAETYKSHSSRSAAKFFQDLHQVTPYLIRAVQTDNGSEFLGQFDKELEKRGIVHFFSYPRSPKQNAHIERFNRTLQEEFVDANTQDLPNLPTFNNKLITYLLFYNTERPHQALKYQSPMAVVVKHLQKSNMYVTNTSPCRSAKAVVSLVCSRQEPASDPFLSSDAQGQNRMFNTRVMEHTLNPRNVGTLPGATHYGR